jgi:ADP-heptose:LPS heptosyltransferase
VVSPLSTGKLGVKAYPPEHWQQVVWNLSALGYHLALVGSPGDAARHAQLMATAGPGRVVSLAGLTPALVLAGVARRAAGVVGVDTGPLHVAAAVGTRCVVLFGPSDPALTAPCGEGHIVLYRDLECQPCQTGPCYHQGRCMRELTPRAVVEAVQRLLAGGAEPPARALEWQPPRAAAKDASHAAG